MKVVKVAAINMDSTSYECNFRCDSILQNFAKGINKQLLPASDAITHSLPLVGRGMSESVGKYILLSMKNNLPFYHIDTGYFGNVKRKVWHRITYNGFQNTNTFIPRDKQRLSQQLLSYFGQDIQMPLEKKINSFTPGKKILICPPSKKVMGFFQQLSPQEWTEKVIKELRQYTDRPIEVRLKPSRTDRQTVKNMKDALKDDIHCLVTYNSIAATEALMAGKPAIALGPNAAQSICETDLKNIENPKIPTQSEMIAFLTHLSYCQFTQTEMYNGFAWKHLQH